MPWAKNSELPAGVKNNLPDHAQTIWRSAANSVLQKGGTDSSAAKIAWAAVKQKYEKDDKGNWVAKKQSAEAAAFDAVMFELELAWLERHPFDSTTVQIDRAGAAGQLELRALVAETIATKAQGMAGLSFDGFDAMLFVEPVETRARFHMKGCIVPMQVLWFDAEGNFMDRASMDLGDEVTEYEPQQPFKYALELPMSLGQVGAEGDRLLLSEVRNDEAASLRPLRGRLFSHPK